MLQIARQHTAEQRLRTSTTRQPRKQMQNHFISGRKPWRALQRHIAPIILAGSIVVIGANAVKAQDASALVDKLVKKGILTDKEGAEVRADMQKEFAQTPAGK